MLFGKPDAYPNRRLGIIFAPDVETAIAARAKISISYQAYAGYQVNKIREIIPSKF